MLPYYVRLLRLLLVFITPPMLSGPSAFSSLPARAVLQQSSPSAAGSARGSAGSRPAVRLRAEAESCTRTTLQRCQVPPF